MAKCRPGHRPWSEHRRKPDRGWLVEQRETEPDSGKPKKLAERTQHDEVATAHIAGEAKAGRSHIHECLVDHQDATAGPQLCGKSEQRFPVDEPAVGAVGIGDDGEIGIASAEVGTPRFDDAMAGKTRRAGVLVIGRRQNSRLAAPRQSGDERQQALRARRQHDMRRRRRAV